MLSKGEKVKVSKCPGQFPGMSQAETLSGALLFGEPELLVRMTFVMGKLNEGLYQARSVPPALTPTTSS